MLQLYTGVLSFNRNPNPNPNLTSVYQKRSTVDMKRLWRHLFNARKH